MWETWQRLSGTMKAGFVVGLVMLVGGLTYLVLPDFRSAEATWEEEGERVWKEVVEEGKTKGQLVGDELAALVDYWGRRYVDAWWNVLQWTAWQQGGPSLLQEKHDLEMWVHSYEQLVPHTWFRGDLADGLSHKLVGDVGDNIQLQVANTMARWSCRLKSKVPGFAGSNRAPMCAEQLRVLQEEFTAESVADDFWWLLHSVAAALPSQMRGDTRKHAVLKEFFWDSFSKYWPLVADRTAWQNELSAAKIGDLLQDKDSFVCFLCSLHQRSNPLQAWHPLSCTSSHASALIFAFQPSAHRLFHRFHHYNKPGSDEVGFCDAPIYHGIHLLNAQQNSGLVNQRFPPNTDWVFVIFMMKTHDLAPRVLKLLEENLEEKFLAHKVQPMIVFEWSQRETPRAERDLLLSDKTVSAARYPILYEDNAQSPSWYNTLLWSTHMSDTDSPLPYGLLFSHTCDYPSHIRSDMLSKLFHHDTFDSLWQFAIDQKFLVSSKSLLEHFHKIAQTHATLLEADLNPL